MKENSHIKFLTVLKELGLQDADLSKHAFLGAVFPDIMFYSKSTHEFADFLHGARGENTSEFPMLVLKKAKESKDMKLLHFALGFLSHGVLDAKTHPKVYEKTGNYYDKDLAKRRKARIAHRHLEMLLDCAYTDGKSYKSYKVSFFDLGSSLRSILKDNYGVSWLALFKAFFKYKIFNRFFHSKLGAKLLSFFEYPNYPNIDLALISNCKDKNMKEALHAFKEFEEEIREAELEFKAVASAVFGYYKSAPCDEKLYLQKVQELFPGKSFDTGKTGVGVV